MEILKSNKEIKIKISIKPKFNIRLVYKENEIQRLGNIAKWVSGRPNFNL